MLQVFERMRTVRFRPWGALFVLACIAGCSLADDDDDDGPANAGGAGNGAGGMMVTLPGGGTSGDGGTSGEPEPEPTPMCETLQGLGQCGTMTVEATFKTVNMLLVIDKSGSMEDVPDGFDDDKWTSMKLALDAALGNVATEINFGLLLYPMSLAQPIPLDNCGGTCCEVPEGLTAVNVGIGPGQDTLPEISRALENVSPGGGTPTAAALQRAHQYFTEGDGANLQGERYVLLATDGGPNCNTEISCEPEACTTNLDGDCETENCCTLLRGACVDDQAVNDAIAALAADGIPTFVVGIPGTEAYASFLNEFARTGGVPAPVEPPAPGEPPPPEYYAVSAMGGVQGLIDVFSTITTQLVRSCDIELANEPPKLDEVNVAVDCEVMPSMDPDAGWEIDTSQAPATVLRLKGELCASVQETGAQRVDVVYGCPTIR